MGKGVHSRISYLLGRERFHEIGVNDSHIGRNVEISQRIFDPGSVIGNNGKCGYFGSRSGG